MHLSAVQRAVLAAGSAALAPLAAAQLAPFPALANPFNPVRVTASADAVLIPGGEGLTYVSTSLAEPRVQLEAGAAWTDARFLVLDVVYTGARTGLVRLYFHHRGENQPRCIAGFSVVPGLPARLALPLEALKMTGTKLERTPNTLRNGLRGRAADVDKLGLVTLDLKGDPQEQRLQIFQAALVFAAPAHPAHRLPLVDALGQWTQRDWPGKTGDAAELRPALEAELASAVAARYPAGWSAYGGDTSRSFKPGRFFRLERDGDRWWLVDPSGAAFFSLGLDVVTPRSAGPLVPGHEGLYAELPPTQPASPRADGRPSSPSPQLDFLELNLRTAFGPAWLDRWHELTAGRLRAWRYNTVGNWADPEFCRRAGLPYVTQLPAFPRTAVALYRDFPDVFDPAFAQEAAVQAKSLEATRDDPLLIGYFMINEPSWGFGLTNLAARMLEQHPGTHSRRALAAWLRDQYHGDSDAFAQAWAGVAADFTDVETKVVARADEHSALIAADLDAFSRVLIRRYVEIPVQAARAVDPNHLNLGYRYAYIANETMLAGGELFDVFSINAYAMRPPIAEIERIAQASGRPVMIGEFHFGARDAGLISPGLRGVHTQADRGRAYRYYVEQGAAHPAVVGIHYFQLNDQPFLGRGDGESYQIGMVDICSRPHAAFASAVTATNAQLYEVAAGKRPPTDDIPVELPNSLIETTPLNGNREHAQQ